MRLNTYLSVFDESDKEYAKAVYIYVQHMQTGTNSISDLLSKNRDIAQTSNGFWNIGKFRESIALSGLEKLSNFNLISGFKFNPKVLSEAHRLVILREVSVFDIWVDLMAIQGNSIDPVTKYIIGCMYVAANRPKAAAHILRQIIGETSDVSLEINTINQLYGISKGPFGYPSLDKLIMERNYSVVEYPFELNSLAVQTGNRTMLKQSREVIDRLNVYPPIDITTSLPTSRLTKYLLRRKEAKLKAMRKNAS